MPDAEAVLAYGICLPDEAQFPWAMYEEEHGQDQGKLTITQWWLNTTGFGISPESPEYNTKAEVWIKSHPMPVVFHPYNASYDQYFLAAPPGYSRTVMGYETATIIDRTLTPPSKAELDALLQFIQTYLDPLNPPQDDALGTLPSNRPLGWWLVANAL